MGNRVPRISNGQRAAVCGLRLAGVPMMVCCKIVDIPYTWMQRQLQPDWFERHRKPKKWRGEIIEELKAAYLDRHIRMSTVALMFDTSEVMVRQLAKKYGWRRRKRGPGQREPQSVRSMTPKQRYLYKKLQPIVGRSRALAQVFP